MNRKMKALQYLTIFSLGCLICLPIPLSAQTGKINPKVEVQRDYEGSIPKTDKPKMTLVTPDSLSRFAIRMDYTIFDKPFRDLYTFSPLPSVKLLSQKQQKQPWIYARMGLAYPTSPDGEIMIQAPLKGLSSLKLIASHSSFRGSLPLDLANPHEVIADRSQNQLALRYALNWDKGNFEVGGAYHRHIGTYYGFAPFSLADWDRVNQRSFMRDSMSHITHNYQAHMSISSLPSHQEGLYWGFGFRWSLMEELASLMGIEKVPYRQENLLGFKAEMGGRFLEHHSVGIDILGSFSNALGSSEIDRGVISFAPMYRYQTERLNLGVGFRVSGMLNNAPDVEGASQFSCYLLLNASYRLLPKFWLYADIHGEDRHNTFHSMMRENPWLAHDLNIQNSRIPWILKAGVKGNIIEHLAYDASLSYTKTNNQYYFINQVQYYAAVPPAPGIMPPSHPDLQTSYNLFDFIYNDEERFTAAASLLWDSAPFQAHASVQYHNYALEQGRPLWHKPTLEFDFSARYAWRERIIASLSVTYRNAVYAPLNLPSHPSYSSALPTPTADHKINGFTLVDLKLEYCFASWFSVYGEAKNLLNAKEQYFLLYREPGIRVGGGVSFRF